MRVLPCRSSAIARMGVARWDINHIKYASIPQQGKAAAVPLLPLWERMGKPSKRDPTTTVHEALVGKGKERGGQANTVPPQTGPMKRGARKEEENGGRLFCTPSQARRPFSPLPPCFQKGAGAPFPDGCLTSLLSPRLAYSGRELAGGWKQPPPPPPPHVPLPAGPTVSSSSSTAGRAPRAAANANANATPARPPPPSSPATRTRRSVNSALLLPSLGKLRSLAQAHLRPGSSLGGPGPAWERYPPTFACGRKSRAEG